MFPNQGQVQEEGVRTIDYREKGEVADMIVC